MNNEEVTSRVCKSMKRPKEYQVVSYIDVVEEAVLVLKRCLVLVNLMRQYCLIMMGK